jgi:predicted cation transporter
MSVEAKIAVGISVVVVVSGLTFYVLYKTRQPAIKTAAQNYQPTHIYK